MCRPRADTRPLPLVNCRLGAIAAIDVFDATGAVPEDRPAEIRIGDSLIIVSSAEARQAFPAFLYIYVKDADRTYRRALAAGAISLEPPLDTPYGDRRSMVRDRFGNVYQIAHRIESTT